MRQWYRITAKKNNTAKILIYEQIGEDWFGDGVSAKKFISELNDLDVEIIDLYINSPGGNVFDGNSIYNALRRHPALVNVTVDGIAASIASVIAMAGDEIEMPQNALMMIHDPSALVRGTAADMAKMIEALDRIKTGMIGAYTAKASIADDKIAEMMTAETWMTAQEAHDFGFADKITEPVQMAASFEALTEYKNVPAGLMETAGRIITTTRRSAAATGQQEASDMDITLELIQSKHPEIVAAILKSVDLEHVRAQHPQIIEALQAEGATAEAKRIQDVKAQLIPGHEALIETLMFDGKTTGEQAAVQVLAAEKKVRGDTAAAHTADAPPVLRQPADGDDVPDVDDSLPLDKRCAAKWEKDAALRAEFGDNLESYVAYEEAAEKGRVRVLKK